MPYMEHSPTLLSIGCRDIIAKNDNVLLKNLVIEEYEEDNDESGWIMKRLKKISRELPPADIEGIKRKYPSWSNLEIWPRKIKKE